MKAFVWLGTFVPTVEVPGNWHRLAVKPSAPSLCVTCVDPETVLSERYLTLLHTLRRKTHGPGSVYVTKLVLPWILPNVTHAVVLDYDLWTSSSFLELSEEFKKFSSTQQIGLAPDIAWKQLYPNANLGANGGVQVLHLERMRSGTYERALREEKRYIGYLGDQTMYSHISEKHPDMFYHLSCRYNRQMNTHFSLPASAYGCQDGCAILHGNQPRYKHAIKVANEANRTDVLRRIIPPMYRSQFENCF